MHKKQAYVAIANAFKRVTIPRLYRGVWITASDLVRIIIHAHDLLPPTLDTKTLINALKSTFSGAEDRFGDAGLFRQHYTPNGCSRVYCYFFVHDKGVRPRSDTPLPWYQYIRNVDVFQNDSTNIITEEQKLELATALKNLSGVATPKPGTKKDSAVPISARKPAPTVPSITGLKRSAALSFETPVSKRPAREKPAVIQSPVSAAVTKLHPNK
jgi:hypothetical protein